MKFALGSFSLTIALAIAASAVATPLKSVQLSKIGRDDRLSACTYQWRTSSNCSEVWNDVSRNNLKQAIDNSLNYLSTPKAARDYRHSSADFDLPRVRRSLVRFRQLLLNAASPAAFERAVSREFALYESVGNDDRGTVEFTGYYEPLFEASRVPTAEYRYPLYRPLTNLPAKKIHPTRTQLEGEDGLGGSKGILAGRELVWLRDRLEAYLT